MARNASRTAVILGDSSRTTVVDRDSPRATATLDLTVSAEHEVRVVSAVEPFLPKTGRIIDADTNLCDVGFSGRIERERIPALRKVVSRLRQMDSVTNVVFSTTSVSRSEVSLSFEG